MVLMVAINIVPMQNDAMATRGNLNLDGILVLRTERTATAKVVILPISYPARAMENVAGKFSLSLLLDEIYLLSFEREGMVTKQIYFDTAVPVEKIGEQMTFPFKVTLYPVGKDGIYAYAGPVGYVHYDAGLQDFTYETDYTLMPGAPMTRRIQNMMTRMADRGEDGLPLGAGNNHGLPQVAKVEVPAMTAVAVSTAVDIPTVTSVPAQHDAMEPPTVVRLMDLIEAREEQPSEALIAGVAPAPTFSETGEPAERPSAMTPSAEDRMPVAEAPEPVPATAPAAKPVAPATNRPAAPAVVAPKPVAPATTVRGTELPPVPVADARDLPEEEMIVERNRVITVVRITEVTGHVTEYRRVVDRSGMVTYFQDGVSIPEPLYRERTGR
jgi:hypothetical protein